jgi:SAM-dependent methyltransferase
VAPGGESPAVYETIGVGYRSTRRPDPRLERRVHAALGDAPTVLNVGAGAGSYEPSDRTVVALEPSDVMLAQRPAGAAPAVRGVAEALPFAGGTFAAALAVLTIHHWTDPFAGLAEMCRVARRQVVFHFDMDVVRTYWLTDYFPESVAFDLARTPTIPAVVAALGGGPGGSRPVRVEVLPVPRDCSDGFMAAYWHRPEAYLDAEVRAGISSFALLDDEVLAPGLGRLRADLESGAWHERNAAMLRREEIDAGYRLLVAGPPLHSG